MKYVTGDLIQMAKDGDFDVIVHGCNINCIMGSGIAFAIANEWPIVPLMDSLTMRSDMNKLGSIQHVWVNDDLVVMNMYTQATTGKAGLHVSYHAVQQGFVALKLWLTQLEYNLGRPARIGIPKIGAGLGGGNWEVIERIIDNQKFKDLTCVLYGG